MYSLRLNRETAHVYIRDKNLDEIFLTVILFIFALICQALHGIQFSLHFIVFHFIPFYCIKSEVLTIECKPELNGVFSKA